MQRWYGSIEGISHPGCDRRFKDYVDERKTAIQGPESSTEIRMQENHSSNLPFALHLQRVPFSQCHCR